MTESWLLVQPLPQDYLTPGTRSTGSGPRSCCPPPEACRERRHSKAGGTRCRPATPADPLSYSGKVLAVKRVTENRIVQEQRVWTETWTTPRQRPDQPPPGGRRDAGRGTSEEALPKLRPLSIPALCWTERCRHSTTTGA